MIMMGDKKKLASVILGEPKQKPEEGAEQSALSVIAEDLISCVNNADADGVAECLRAAFLEMEASPHAEGPHLDEE